jgi:hypothetical protein
VGGRLGEVEQREQHERQCHPANRDDMEPYGQLAPYARLLAMPPIDASGTRWLRAVIRARDRITPGRAPGRPAMSQREGFALAGGSGVAVLLRKRVKLRMSHSG